MNIPTSKKGLLASLINGTEKLRREIVEFLSSKSKIELDTTKSNRLIKDDSIIDVSGETYKISQANQSQTKGLADLTVYKADVPAWTHQYIYSFSAINGATKEQREFYRSFKNRFLRGENVDLEDNSNYAFVLLFDLLEAYESHRNSVKLENQLEMLGRFYPKTKSYAVSFLARILEAEGDYDGAERITYEYRNNYDYYDYWSFGNKYKTKLNLKDEEVKLLNKISYPNNNFCNVEFCCLEIIKLYLSAVRELNSKYILEETTLDAEIAVVADLAARKEFRYRYNSQNYNYCIESISNDIYSNIFKHCENAVREFYGHKRKLSIVNTNLGGKTEYETRIGEKVSEVIAELKPLIALPDEATDVELYAQNTSRWKIKFGELTANYKDDGQQFIDKILRLAKLNRKNPSVENIFYEASKFIAKSNKQASLTLYVYYLYYDLKSATFDNKKLAKTIQKSLFKTNEQLRDFEIIVGELIKDRNLEKALREVSKIYVVKRKKIQLNTDLINEVQQQHIGTVELLNEFLQDEYEDESNTITTRQINEDEIKIEITQKAETISDSMFTSEIAFTPIHTATLEIFYKNSFTVSQSDLEIFAKSQKAFKNQLIDSLNETCYEFLDDVLIEEEDDYFTISENYYQKLLAK